MGLPLKKSPCSEGTTHLSRPCASSERWKHQGSSWSNSRRLGASLPSRLYTLHAEQPSRPDDMYAFNLPIHQPGYHTRSFSSLPRHRHGSSYTLNGTYTGRRPCTAQSFYSMRIHPTAVPSTVGLVATIPDNIPPRLRDPRSDNSQYYRSIPKRTSFSSSNNSIQSHPSTMFNYQPKATLVQCIAQRQAKSSQSLFPQRSSNLFVNSQSTVI
jgi:hypothetical protein